MNDPADIIARYCKMARPIMRNWMPKNSCIGSTRVTLAAMHSLKLRARPVSVSFAFAVPARKYMRTAGFTEAERTNMRAAAASWVELHEENGWDGHLVALVEERWLLDAAVDQATSEEYGVTIPEEVLAIDLGGGAARFGEGCTLEVRGGMNSGEEITLQYSTVERDSYRHTEAWKDEGAVLLGRFIAAQLSGRRA